MVEHGGSSADSYLADPTSPIPSHCASIVVTGTVNCLQKSCKIYSLDKTEKYLWQNFIVGSNYNRRPQSRCIADWLHGICLTYDNVPGNSLVQVLKG